MNLDDWLIQNENLTVEEINEILRGMLTVDEKL